MPKFVEVENKRGYFLFVCPGCQMCHFVNTNPEYGTTWQFNKDIDKPTVSPSLLVKYPFFHSFDRNEIGVKGTEYTAVCHSFIRDGRIEYLSDCTHELKNKIVDIPDF